MAREYKILQIALGAEDVEMALNHTIRDDWEFLSCVALSPTVLCYTFQREKLPARGGRKRIEDASPVSSPEFDRMSVEEQEKALDSEFRNICKEVSSNKISTSVGADEVAAAVVASKVVSTRKAKKILSRSEKVEHKPTKKVPEPEHKVVAFEQSNVRISPRTGKPVRVYKKRIK